MFDGRVQVLDPVTGEVVADHALLAPGETSIVDEHYGSTRSDKPRRAPRAKTAEKNRILALGGGPGRLRRASRCSAARCDTVIVIPKDQLLALGDAGVSVMDAFRSG